MRRRRERMDVARPNGRRANFVEIQEDRFVKIDASASVIPKL
jgi:hypothetical protein